MHDDDFEIITTHDGRKSKVLKDGHALRTPMMMCDAMTPVQRAIAAHIATRGHDKFQDKIRRDIGVVDALGNSDALAMSRPGARYLAPRAQHKTDYARQVTLDYMKREAYRLADEADANAYRNVEAKSGIWPLNAGAREGDACDLNGERGTLVREGDHLVCRIARPVRPSRSSGDALSADELEAAYKAYDEDAAQAWRNPR
jgi:hypothetical protein